MFLLHESQVKLHFDTQNNSQCLSVLIRREKKGLLKYSVHVSLQYIHKSKALFACELSGVYIVAAERTVFPGSESIKWKMMNKVMRGSEQVSERKGETEREMQTDKMYAQKMMRKSGNGSE